MYKRLFETISSDLKKDIKKEISQIIKKQKIEFEKDPMTRNYSWLKSIESRLTELNNILSTNKLPDNFKIATKNGWKSTN